MKNFNGIITAFITLLCALLVLSGCASVAYHGQYDSSIPNEEQAILIISSNLKNIYLNDSLISGGFREQSLFGEGENVIKIPAGTYTITADYMDVSSSTSGDVRTVTTRTAKGITVTFNFKAGQFYEINPIRSSNTVSLSIEATGSSVIDYSASVGVGWILGMDLGQDANTYDDGYPKSPMAAGIIDFQIGFLYPGGKTTWGLNLLELDMALGYEPFSNRILVNSRAGLSADFYFGQGRILPGLGFGGGIVYVLNYADEQWKNDALPYIRGSFIIRGKSQAKFFVDYYFYEQDELWRQFGTGLLLAF